MLVGLSVWVWNLKVDGRIGGGGCNVLSRRFGCEDGCGWWMVFE